MDQRYKFYEDRNQLTLFPTLLDELIPQDSIVRVIDAFVDSLDLSNFKYGTTSNKGNRPYNPADMLKLYLYGYRQGVRASRKLMYHATYNIEYIWLLKNVKPDFRTIADFRKDNIDLFKDIFFEFNIHCKELGILSNITSQDGTKLKAVNSKDKNFTYSKIDDRKKHALNRIEHYNKILTTVDDEDEKQEIQTLIELAEAKLVVLDNYEKEMRQNNVTQKSLTDPEAKLMRDNGKFTVGYNNQVCVDVNSQLISNFDITDKPADLGSITNVSIETKEKYNFDTITNITDKGYNDRDDMINALENGIIPEVTPLDGITGFNLETDYEENAITDDDIKSTNPKDIRKCLRAGVIPDVYKNNIESIEVKEITILEDDRQENAENLSEDELRDIAMKENCFSKDIISNKVFCPMGEILRKKSNTKGGARYANKMACQKCKNPCTQAQFKVVEFKNNNTFVKRKEYNKKRKNRAKKIVKKVFIKTKPNIKLLKLRMQTSEHPHASMKFWDNSRYLLLKGKRKVTGEVALYYSAYNIRRAVNLLGTEVLIEYFKQKTLQKIVHNSINSLYFMFISKKALDNSRTFFIYRTFSPTSEHEFAG